MSEPIHLKPLRFAVVLLMFLLAIGQQEAMLHRLGHDLAEVVAAAPAEVGETTVSAAGSGQAPDEDGHVGACSLCVGFCGFGAAAPSSFSASLPVPAATYGLPRSSSCAVMADARGTASIRGPPEPFSRKS